jgi:hypothetical protein
LSDVELLRRDIHPAEILMPSGALVREARVFVTTDRVLVYRRVDGTIVKEYELPLADPGIVPAQRGSLNGGRLEMTCRFALSDGEQLLPVIVNQGAGCGCGSPLKALAPPVGWTR